MDLWFLCCIIYLFFYIKREDKFYEKVIIYSFENNLWESNLNNYLFVWKIIIKCHIDVESCLHVILFKYHTFIIIENFIETYGFWFIGIEFLNTKSCKCTSEW